jgi:hypothetical protein
VDLVKTNELISLLTEDTPVRIRLGRVLTTALIAGTAISAVMLLSTVGIRHDISSAIETARVLFKVGLMLTLVVVAAAAVFRIGRPGVSLRPVALALLIPLGLLIAAVAIELSVLPSQAWESQLMGHNARFCLMFIPVLSLAPLAGFMLALRNGAPERPTLAGAAAGLASGAIAAALYAWHCVDDSPLFVATWYTIAIAAVTAIGAVFGRRYLRW